MHISLRVSHFYEWLPKPADVADPSEADIAAGLAKRSPVRVDAHGNELPPEWMMKVTLAADEPRDVDISIHESQLESLMPATPKRGARNRKQVVADLLQQQLLQHHAPADKIIGVSVSGEPDVEAFLRSYFDVKEA